MFGILNLAFAVWGLFGLAVSVPMFFGPRGGVPNPVLDLMNANPAYMAFMKVSLVLGGVAAVVLAISGIGLLLCKAWGRTLAIGYGVYAVVMGVVGMVANYFWLLKPLMEKAAQAPAGPDQAAFVGGLAGGLCGGCFGLIYPIILLYFMFRPTVIAAFQRRDDVLPFGPA